jgi:hypothetical protein
VVSRGTARCQPLSLSVACFRCRSSASSACHWRLPHSRGKRKRALRGLASVAGRPGLLLLLYAHDVCRAILPPGVGFATFYQLFGTMRFSCLENLSCQAELFIGFCLPPCVQVSVACVCCLARASAFCRWRLRSVTRLCCLSHASAVGCCRLLWAPIVCRGRQLSEARTRCLSPGCHRLSWARPVI